MRKYLIAALAICAAGTAFYFYSESRITNYPSAGTDIIAFGDSLTYGRGSSTGGYVGALSRELGMPIINLGISGDTTADALARVGEISKYNPKVVILLLGGNDFLAHVPRATTLKNLGEIIEKIQALGSVVLLVDLQDDVYEPLAKKYQTAYVSNILGGIYGFDEYMSDSLHPNDAGYRIMAERIKVVLEKVIK